MIDPSALAGQAYDAWNEEIEKPPAGATAEGNETKTNGKQGNDFNV